MSRVLSVVRHSRLTVGQVSPAVVTTAPTPTLNETAVVAPVRPRGVRTIRRHARIYFGKPATSQLVSEDFYAALNSRMDGAFAAVTSEASARVSGDSAVASSVTSLSSSFSTYQGTANGRLTTLEGTTGTLGTRMTTAEASIVTANAAITSGDAAVASTVTTLNASFTSYQTTANGRLSTLEGSTGTLGTNLGALTTRVTTAEAAITTEATTRATADSANASTISALSSSFTSYQTTNNSAVSSAATAASRIRVFRQSTTPTAGGVGDVWFNTGNQNKPYAWDGTSWVLVDDQQIGAVATVAGRVRVFRQGSAPSAGGVGDVWYNTSDSNRPYVWDGSAWVISDDTRIATANAAITSEATTRATADSAMASQISSLTANLTTTQVTLADLNPLDAAITWNFNGTADGWTGQNATVTAQAAAARVSSANTDPMFRSPSGLGIDGSKDFIVQARITRVAGSGWEGSCFYSGGTYGESYSSYKIITNPQLTPGQSAVLTWDMSALTAGGTDWTTHTISQIRLDFGASAADVFDVDWVAIGKRGPGTYNVAIAAANAAITTEQTARVNGDAANATSITTLTSSFNTYKTTNDAALATTNGNLGTTNSNLGALTTRVTTAESAITSEASTRATADSTNATAISTLNSSFTSYQTTNNSAVSSAAAAASRIRVFRQSTTPTAGGVGDVWYNTSDSNRPYVWDGSAWVISDDTRIAAANAAITSEATTRATADSAMASQITSLTANLTTTQVTLADVNPLEAAISWNFSNTADGWTPYTPSTTLTAQASSLRLTTSTGDMIFYSPTIAVDGSKDFLVQARITRVAGSGWDGTCYHFTAGHGESGSYYKNIANPGLTAGQSAVLTWDMSALTTGGADYITNTITKIRLDLGATSADVFDVDWVAIGKRGPGNYNVSIATNAAAITSEATTRASADSALSSTITTVSAASSAAQSTANTGVANAATAQGTANTALANAAAAQATANTATASITTETTARTSSDIDVLRKASQQRVLYQYYGPGVDEFLPFGFNRIMNADGRLQMTERAVSWNNLGYGDIYTNPGSVFGGEYMLQGGYTFAVYCTRSPVGGDLYFDITYTNSYKIPVTAGNYYEASVYVGTFRCRSYITIAWFNSSGAYITEVSGNSVYASEGYVAYNNYGAGLSNYKRTWVIAQAPTGAAYCTVYLRNNVTSPSENYPISFSTLPYFGICRSGQSAPSDWSNGPDVLLVHSGDSNRLYRWNGQAWALADDTRIAATASQVSTIQTTVNGHTSSITSQQTAINGLSALASLRVNGGGAIAGYDIYAGGGSSVFRIQAENFEIVGSGGGAASPFRVAGGVTYINEARIANGAMSEITAGMAAGYVDLAVTVEAGAKLVFILSTFGGGPQPALELYDLTGGGSVANITPAAYTFNSWTGSGGDTSSWYAQTIYLPTTYQWVITPGYTGYRAFRLRNNFGNYTSGYATVVMTILQMKK